MLHMLSLLRVSCLILTFCTGAAGLIYEVTWHRYLSNLLGSEARAAAIILAVFLAGLALGYSVFGWLARRVALPTRLVRIFGLTEVGIGAWALLFPPLYEFLWGHVGVLPAEGSWALLGDIAVSSVLVLVPTVLMGGTLPLLTQGLSRSLSDSSRFHAQVYATNTAGACLGCVLAGFILLPRFGLPLTVMGTSLVNITAGVLLLLVAKLLPSQEPSTSSNAPDESLSSQRGALSLNRAIQVAFISGFCSLALQTIIIRLVGLSMGSSEYAFSMVVAVFVLMLAWGAWRFAEHAPIALPVNQLLVVLGLFALYVHAPLWPWVSHVVRSLLTPLEINFYLYHLIVFFLLAVVLFFPIGPLGSSLPLLFNASRRHMTELGSVVGRLYAWNTVGCVLGALLGGHLLLYWYNFDELLKIILILATINLALLLPERSGYSGRIFKAASLLFLLLVVGSLPLWDKRHFAIGTFRIRKAHSTTFAGPNTFYEEHFRGSALIEYKDDPNTTVALVEHGLEEKNSPSGIAQGRFLSLYVNGKSDGATRGYDLRTTRLLAHLPALLQTDRECSGVVIGFGTGITVGSLLLHPQLRSVDAIEIAPFIRTFAPHFDFANHAVTKDARMRWQVGDAYRVLASQSRPWCVVVSEPSNPWMIGVERLYTKEFYTLVRERLTRFGIYAQWIHSYDMQAQTVALVLNTFASVFPSVRVFALDADLILLGSKEPIGEHSLEGLSAKLAQEELRAELLMSNIHSVEELLAFEVPIVRSALAGFGLHTLDFPKLAFRAGKDFFLGRTSTVESIFESEKESAEYNRAGEELLRNQ